VVQLFLELLFRCRHFWLLAFVMFIIVFRPESLVLFDLRFEKVDVSTNQTSLSPLPPKKTNVTSHKEEACFHKGVDKAAGLALQRTVDASLGPRFTWQKTDHRSTCGYCRDFNGTLPRK